jgi:trigger factor
MESATQAQEFSNDLVQFKVHKKPSCRIEFEVSASKSLAEQARMKAIKNIAKDVTLPGFRKGKAPDALILKNYPNDVDKKWQECIADKAFQECENLAKIPLLSRETRVSFSMKAHSLEGAELLLSFETEPVIPSVDPAQYQPVDVERPKVDSEKVDETIRQILFFFAEWTSIKDRPVQEGDFVTLDVDIIESTPHTPLFAGTRFEVTDKSMAKWMKDLVLGKKILESVEGVSVPDADLKQEEKEAFKPQKVRIVIKSIDQAKLPEVNEEFLKKLGVGSQEELKANIEKLLNKQADAHVKEKQREHVNEFLLTQYPFDLPTTLIEKETQFRMKQLSGDPSFLKYWRSLKEEDKKKAIDSIYFQSEKAVRMFYLHKIFLNLHPPRLRLF